MKLRITALYDIQSAQLYQVTWIYYFISIPWPQSFPPIKHVEQINAGNKLKDLRIFNNLNFFSLLRCITQYAEFSTLLNEIFIKFVSFYWLKVDYRT